MSLAKKLSLKPELRVRIMWKRLLKEGVQGVRQIALDPVWSAMRFRPKP